MKWPGKKYKAQGILEDRAEKVAGCMKIIAEAAVQDGEALITVDSVRKMHDRFLRGEVKAGWRGCCMKGIAWR